MDKILIYDAEIAKCIPNPYEFDATLEYCEGWRDFQNMGVALVGCFTNWDGAYRVFDSSMLSDFQLLVDQSDEIVGFNSLAFDDQLMAANGVQIETTYDLLPKIWVAAGLPPVYTPGQTKPGYSLDAIAKSTFGCSKTGNGGNAPKLWQRGQLIPLINYLLQDVNLTRRLFYRRSHLIDPTNGQILKLED